MAFAGMDVEQAFERAEDIRRKVALLTMRADSVNVSITMSAGIACYPQHGGDMATLFVAADAALYRAKNDGRNRVVIAKAMQVC